MSAKSQTTGKGELMYLRHPLIFTAALCLLAGFAFAQNEDGVELNLDEPIQKALSSPEARAAVEKECLDALEHGEEWGQQYGAAKILAVIGTVDTVPALVALFQDEKKAHLARCALAPMPYAEVDAALLEALPNAPRKVKLGIMDTLADRKVEEAVPAIIAGLKIEDKQMLELAATALARIGGDQAAAFLQEMCKADDTEIERIGATALLLLAENLNAAGSPEDAAACYYPLLENKWADHIRAGAFRGLLKALPKEATEAVLHAIQSDDLFLRQDAIAAVAQLEAEGTAAQFADLFHKLDKDIQVPLLESLSRRNEALQQTFLFDLLKDTRDDLRIAAMKAIAVYGNEEAIVPLARIFGEDGSREIRQAAVETLRRLQGADMEGALVASLTSLPMEERSGIIEVLVQRNIVAAAPAILEECNHEGTRAAAFKALGMLGDTAFIDPMLALLLTMEGDTGRSEAENALVALIQHAGLKEAKLIIQRARYGDLPDGEFKDVTAVVREKIAESTFSFPVGSALFGDPAPGKAKQLIVDFTRRDAAEAVTVPEGGLVNFAAGSIPDDLLNKVIAPLDDASADASASLFRVLGRIAGTRAYEIVKSYITNDSEALVDAAVRVLTSWPDPAAAADLAALFTSSEHSTHRVLALRGAVRLLRVNALPQDAAIAAYRLLLDGARNADDRKLILSGLAELDSAEAVQMVYPLCSDETVKAEAGLALDKLRGAMTEEAYNDAIAPFTSEEAQTADAPIVDETFVSIFNGSSLAGWSGDPDFWYVDDGAIVGETRADKTLARNVFLIWTEDTPADFDIKFTYKVESDWANSGLQFRSERFDDNRLRGYQADLSTEDWITGICYEEGGRGVLARRGEAVVVKEDDALDARRFAAEEVLLDYIDHHEWNEYEVHVRGNHFYSRINGHKMHEVTDHSPKARKRGFIGFQLHQGPPMKIRIRDIKINRVAPQQ